jgi:hypothetical protein
MLYRHRRLNRLWTAAAWPPTVALAFMVADGVLDGARRGDFGMMAGCCWSMLLMFALAVATD